MKRCKNCKTPLVVSATGRTPIWCSPACKQAAYRKRKKRSIHFRSKSCEWATPQEFFDRLNAVWAFTLDVCAAPENAKCQRYYTRDQDGLSQPWHGRVWCNPPYGRATPKWLAKAHHATASGEAEVVVCLVFARTDTRWWHTYAFKLAEVVFLQGRLPFNGSNPAPFPSAVLVFRNGSERYETCPIAATPQAVLPAGSVE
jgi:phage N-6-adenine-methyltransferase